MLANTWMGLAFLWTQFSLEHKPLPQSLHLPLSVTMSNAHTHTHTHTQGFPGFSLGSGHLVCPTGCECSRAESEDPSGGPWARTGVSKRQEFSFGRRAREASLRTCKPLPGEALKIWRIRMDSVRKVHWRNFTLIQKLSHSALLHIPS